MDRVLSIKDVIDEIKIEIKSDPKYYRIRYKDLHEHWYQWDKSRHWDSYDWYKREYREHERRRHAKDLHHGEPKPPQRDIKHGREKYKKNHKGGKRNAYNTECL